MLSKEFSNFCKTIQISKEHVSSLKEILNLVTATSDENEEVEAAIRGQIELITDPKTKEEVKKLFSLLG
jgi:phosphotransferase system HPr-like phosphotransfer protein